MPTVISTREDSSFHISMCSFKNIKANTRPNTDDVEKIIADFTVPTSFIPFRKRKREPAKPPKLRRRRFGIWYRLIEKAISDTKTIASVTTPPIKDLSVLY
jgi:hypothetical protein